MVGTILADYQPKPTCMTLNQPKFHDFSLKKLKSGVLFGHILPQNGLGIKNMASE